MMNEANTIILVSNTGYVGKLYYQEDYIQGDMIWDVEQSPKELKRWPIEQIEEAKAELAKYRCKYLKNEHVYVEEYALQYCRCDEDGEFLEGSDYELAEIEGDNNEV